jgi:hypothetical protein
MCRRDDYPPHDDNPINPTRVRVIWVRPESPMSTIWLGLGETPEGKRVRFAGDWRPMRDIYEAMQDGDIAMVDLEPWMIMGSLEN